MAMVETSGESSERLATRSETQPSLIRAVGVWALAASMVNIIVGGGIFVLPAVGYKLIGPAAPVAYLLCGAVVGLIMMCFAEAGSRVSRTGGQYAYIEVAFGPFAGILAGMLLWVMGTLVTAVVATLFLGTVAAGVPALGGTIGRTALLVAMIGGFTWVNVRGVRQGTRLVSVVSVAKLLPLLLLLIFGLPAVRSSNIAIPALPAVSSLARASIVLIFAFGGAEAALLPSGEVRNPSRTVPRALAIATIGVVLLYIAIQFVVQGILGSALNDPANAATPLAAAAALALGGWGRTLLIVGASISMFGNVSGMTLAMPRALFAFGENGILPRRLAAVHRRFRTPWVAIIVQSTIVFAIALVAGFERLLVIANLTLLLLYLGSVAAAWELRRRGVRADDGQAPVRLPGGPLVHLTAASIIVFMLSSITMVEWMMVGLILVLASVVFGISRLAGSQRPQPITERETPA